jgi:dipeptidyl aminopeptidase/acylaminoacyl peptidase
MSKFLTAALLNRIGLAFLLIHSISMSLHAQQRPIEMADVHRWNQIETPRISANGQWVAYTVSPYTEGDAEVRIWSAATQTTMTIPRSSQPVFAGSDQWLLCITKAPFDTVRAMKRRKVKTDDLPKDTLTIIELSTGKIEKIARLKSLVVPEKWSDRAFIHLEPATRIKAAPPAKDTSGLKSADSLKVVKPLEPKKETKETGTTLLIRNFATSQTDTLPMVQEFSTSFRQPVLVFTTSGTADAPQWKHRKVTAAPGVYVFDWQRKGTLRPLWRGKGKFQQLNLDEQGRWAAFVADTDTSKAYIRPWCGALCDLSRTDTAEVVATPNSNWLPIEAAPAVLKGRWRINEQVKPVFSEDGGQLFWSIAPPIVVPDTVQLAEEQAQVEVWATAMPQQYSVMKKNLPDDKKRGWPAVMDTKTKQVKVLQTGEIWPSIYSYTRDRNAPYALAQVTQPYEPESQWTGNAAADVYWMDTRNGRSQRIATALIGSPRLSPMGKYAAWWSDRDTAWFAYSPASQKAIRLTQNSTAQWYDIHNDVPDYPSSYGSAGWMPNDDALVVYDHYDLWRVDPTGKQAPLRLTNGRRDKIVYRFITLDPEAKYLPNDQVWLLHTTNETTKTEGYAWFDPKTAALTPWLAGNYAYARTVFAATKSDAVVFTRQNFETYPDLMYVQRKAAANTARTISLANPQQQEYAWPKINLVTWLSLTGDTLQGLLFTPADFNPLQRQYPMIVNFYERLSDGLYLHRPPTFGRSQINPTQYSSMGYVVFMPDIPYPKTGYPGEAAYDAIMSGVQAMIARGGIDARRVALQGHSWGGYQGAYIATRTGFFACAEIGAPVANMTSAYGGIRTESGFARQFQYEHQQSRIGGSLWEKPKQYVENSPLFSADKITTPLLIMHNDKDGAVPWSQGIELFTALRRLDKSAWLLNYVDEPHWPVKLPNRVDFQVRMEQFFDYYLMGQPMPKWMEQGIAPMERDAFRLLERGTN